MEIDIENLKQKYYDRQLSKEDLSVNNLIRLIWYELLGDDTYYINKNPTPYELKKIRYSVNHISVDEELISFCFRQLRNIDKEVALKFMHEYAHTRSHYTYNTKLFKNKLKSILYKTVYVNIFRENKVTLSVCLVLIFSLLGAQIVSVQAFGIGLHQVAIESAQKLFGFKTKNNQPITYSLGWLPDGYKESFMVKDNDLNNGIIAYHYDYSNDKNKITFKIEVHEKGFHNTNIETNGIIKAIVIKNNTYYESENYELNQISWNHDNIIYNLFGNVDKDILREIVENNYKKWS